MHRERRDTGSRSIPGVSGLLDDTAAGVVRESRGGDAALLMVMILLLLILLPLLSRLSVSLLLVEARRPCAPRGLLVLQRVVARPLPEALEETLLLGRVGCVRGGVRAGR